MWNTAFIFSNKIHGQKETCCRLCKNYWITSCAHMKSHAIWVDETVDVIIPIKKIK